MKKLGDKIINKEKYDFIIVDSLNQIHKYFWIHRDFSNKKGEPTGILYGILTMILSLQKKYSSPKIVFCLDAYMNRRKNISGDYKSGRTKKSDDFWTQYNLLINILEYYIKDIEIVYATGYEAEDVASNYLRRIKDKDKRILLYSEDTDWFSMMANKNIHIYRQKEIWERDKVKEYLKKKYGELEIEDFNLFSILYGVSHNKVSGAFNKKKSLLIVDYIKKNKIQVDNYADILNVAQNFPKIKITEDVISKLERNWGLVRLYDKGYKLEIKKSKFNKEKILEFCNRYELKSIEKKLFLKEKKHGK